MIFHMVGDSHTCAFSGTNDYIRHESLMKYFRIYNIIPIQAYMIGEQNKFCEQFFAVVSYLPKNEYIVPIMGEIDIRTTIAQRVAEGMSIEESIVQTLKLFRKGIEKLLTINKNVALWSPFPIFKTYGDPAICNPSLSGNHQICLKYDEAVQSLAKELNLIHFSITKQLFDTGIYTDVSKYIDWCHVRGEVVRELFKPQFEALFNIDITEK